jgi:hypothetical protein
MIGFLARRLIAVMEKRLNSDLSYMRALNLASPGGFDKFLKATALSRHREIVPPAASHAAQLTAMNFEGCGTCLQIAIDQARAAGMVDGVIKAVLGGKPDAMPPDAALAYRFARSILTRAADLDEIRLAVRERWGEKGVVDLTMATQGSRLYPMIKLGLGFAASCQQVRIGAEMMRPG